MQRTFIRLLAETGSPQQAVTAMGKNLSGIEALYKQQHGAESFRAAWDGAIELAAARERKAMRDWVPGSPMLPPHRRGASGPAQEEPDEYAPSMEELETRFLSMFGKLPSKIEQERDARLAGEIVAADFYVRQITFIEVLLDLAARQMGCDTLEYMNALRIGEHGVQQVAETDVSRLLDRARREMWAEMGESMCVVGPRMDRDARRRIA